MKIVFVGCALRLLGTVDEILNRPKAFPSLNIVFYDIDKNRSKVLTTLAKKMPSARNSDCAFEASGDLDDATQDADYVYCCVRVGGIKALERDKRIAAKYGFHGHDDFGPSSVMLTTRTVPIILKLATAMERRCPKAWLLIFTNPISTLVDAVSRYTTIRSVGLCGGVYNFAYDMDHLFEIGTPCSDLIYRGGGLNHLSWVCQESTFQGKPVNEYILSRFDEISTSEGAEKCGWRRCAPLVKLYNAMFLNNGHQHHFFYHDELAKEMAKYFKNNKPPEFRSSKQDSAINEAISLADKEIIDEFWQFDIFKHFKVRPFGDIGVDFMEAIRDKQGKELIITTPNRGHIKGINDGVIIEASSFVINDQINSLNIDPVPNTLKGLCNSIGYHQQQTVDAAMKPEKNCLLKALLSEPTIRSFERAKPMFEELYSAAIASKEIIL